VSRARRATEPRRSEAASRAEQSGVAPLRRSGRLHQLDLRKSNLVGDVTRRGNGRQLPVCARRRGSMQLRLNR
jgi:hypothetical protein